MSRQDKGGRASKQPEQNQNAAEKFKDAGEAHQGKEFSRLFTARHPKKLLRAVGDKQEAGDDPQQTQQSRRPTIHKQFEVFHLAHHPFPVR